LLTGAKPEEAVSPHPTVFRAVGRQLRRAGAELSYGDSPGFGSGSAAAKKAGLAQVADELDIPFADMSQGRQVSFPDGVLVKQFTIANAALDADGIVNVCKMKAHGLTRITGAVKNLFGCVPGTLKGEFHVRMSDQDKFAHMIVDLARCLKPRLHIMDGVIAMEGNGPRGGDPKPMRVILVSEDPVALDATFARLVDLDIKLVLTCVYGEESGFGSGTDIEILGDDVEQFVAPDFVVNRSAGSTTGTSSRVAFLRNLIVPKPVIRPARCTRCGTCVSVCPVSPKAVMWPTPEGAKAKLVPVHHYDRCIRCYCCQELCPEKAIEVETPLLGRLIHRST
jgi:uncharacterized protein (DUF362 family)/ferredoxin